MLPTSRDLSGASSSRNRYSGSSSPNSINGGGVGMPSTNNYSSQSSSSDTVISFQQQQQQQQQNFSSYDSYGNGAGSSYQKSHYGASSSSSSHSAMASLTSFRKLTYILNALCVFTAFLIVFLSDAILLNLFILVLIVASFFFCLHLVKWILNKDASNKDMKQISDAILEGSDEYLNTQYWTVGYIAAITAVLLFILYLFRERINEQVSEVQLGFLTALSFLMGAFCSALAGYVGVWISSRVNIRCAQAASHLNFNDALRLSFRGGAVASILATSLCTLGIMILFAVSSLILVTWGGLTHNDVPITLVGYGFGASFIALFMQLGGGIYTKAADVGADMVGKIEQSIPEDDPRNAATIADLVGDMVGDCNGSMADVFESLAGEIIGTMILGASLSTKSEMRDTTGFLYFPLAVHALDVIVSIIGVMLIKSRSDREDPLVPMRRAYTVTVILAVCGFFGLTRFMLYTEVAPQAWWYYFLCGVIGIIMSYLLVLITQYYTDYKYHPVRKIADASVTGPGTNAIAGLAVGMESTGLPVLVTCISLLLSYYLGASSGLHDYSGGVYGCAVASMGMLCTAGFVLSQNNMGPIADGSNGIVEMAGQSEQVREITDRLDAVGNVVKAATKGYAVGGSALACFVLFHAFLDEMSAVLGRAYTVINLTQVEVIIGGMCGVAMIFVFAGWTMDAVGRAAQQVVHEVRRQFRDNPGIMDGSVKPEYGRCVRIVTQSALKEMIRPAALALLSPVTIGFLFRWIGTQSQPQKLVLGSDAVAGFLIFSALTALVMSTFLNNAGGAWDNAKKLIETGYGGHGKNSLAHQAAVCGDTIGDPAKDTSGPSLSVILTTMSTTVLTLAPFFVSSAARSG